MENPSTEKERSETLIPWGFRHVVIFLAFLGSMCSYMLKFNFSVALVAMVNSSYLTTTGDFHNSSCTEPVYSDSGNQSASWTKDFPIGGDYTDRNLGEKLNWSMGTQSFMLAAPLYGGLASQMISGIVTHRFGIRWVFGTSIFLCSILTLITPLAATWSTIAVIVIRFTQGLTQGSLFPAQTQAVAYWAPVMERSRSFAFIFNGNQIGIILGMLVSGILAGSETMGGWPSIFYVFGVVGCLWSFLWLVLITDFPEQHIRVSKQEIELIRKGREIKESTTDAIPWKDMFTSIPIWSQIIGIIGHSVGFVLLLTELPMYLTNVLHFDIRVSGALSALPFLARFLMAFVGGYISDGLRQSGKISVTAIRKLMTAIGQFGSALCFMTITFVGCDKTLIVALLCLSSAMTGVVSSGCILASVDMCPTFSAAVSGVLSTFALLTGSLVPHLVALLTSSGQTLENWSMAFNICAGILFFTGLQYQIFGSAERQPWDIPKQCKCEGFTNSAMETGELEAEQTAF